MIPSQKETLENIRASDRVEHPRFDRGYSEWTGAGGGAHLGLRKGFLRLYGV